MMIASSACVSCAIVRNMVAAIPEKNNSTSPPSMPDSHRCRALSLAACSLEAVDTCVVHGQTRRQPMLPLLVLTRFIPSQIRPLTLLQTLAFFASCRSGPATLTVERPKLTGSSLPFAFASLVGLTVPNFSARFLFFSSSAAIFSAISLLSAQNSPRSRVAYGVSWASAAFGAAATGAATDGAAAAF